MKKEAAVFIVVIAICLLFSSFAESLSAQDNSTAPGTWSIVASYSIPGKASGLAFDGTYIYFGIYGLNGNNVYRFLIMDPKDYRIV